MSEKQNKEAKWYQDLEKKSLKASLDAGVILPRLIPIRDQIYEVEVSSEMKTFQSNFGTTFTADIKHNGMDKSLIFPKSLKFQLAVAMIRLGLVDKDNNPDFNQLIGRTLILQKTLGNTKQYKDVDLYSVQIK